MNAAAIALKRQVIGWVLNHVRQPDYTYYIAKPGDEYQERAMFVDWRLTSLILQVNVEHPPGHVGDHWLNAQAAQDILVAEMEMPARSHVTHCDIARWIDWEDMRDNPGQGNPPARGQGNGRWRPQTSWQSNFYETVKANAGGVAFADGWRPRAVETAIMPTYQALVNPATIDRLMYMETA